MRRPSSLLLSLLTSLSLIFTGTLSAAHAGMIDSSTLMRMEQRSEIVQDLHATLSEDTLVAQMLDMGLDPDQVMARISGLTDEELRLMHERLQDLPAGGNDLLAVLGIVFVVLLVLEALGVTNIIRVR